MLFRKAVIYLHFDSEFSAFSVLRFSFYVQIDELQIPVQVCRKLPRKKRKIPY